MWFRRIYLIGFPLSILLAQLLRYSMPSRGAADFAKYVPLVCPLHALSGIVCPTCGLGRSLVASWMGHLSAAWSYHFLGPLILAGAGIFWLIILFKIPTAPLTSKINLKNKQTRIVFLIALAVYVIWGFARNFQG